MSVFQLSRSGDLRRVMIAASGWAMLAGSMMAAGCSAELEDGYKLHSLDASPSQRRAYYASPFSPEAEAKSKSGGGGVRPALGGGGQ